MPVSLSSRANPEKKTPVEMPLGADAFSYIAVLTKRFPGTFLFRTGAGRILRDLLLHWPIVPEWEDETLEICQRITDAVYPLTAALYAQAVEITAVISATPIEAPAHIDALSTYVVFDTQQKLERHLFLSPQQALPDNSLLRVGKGIAILCRPLHYRYHTIKDDRKRGRGPGPGWFELSQRLSNLLDEVPFFPPDQKSILEKVRIDIKALPKLIERNETATAANLALRSPTVSPRAAPVIAAVTSISALPPPVRALERRLMKLVADKKILAEMRLHLRRVAQSLRAASPQATIAEAARRDTAPPALIARVQTQPTPLTTAPMQPNVPVAAPALQAKATMPPVAQYASPPRLVPVPLSVHPSVVLATSPLLRTPAPQAPPSAPAPTQRVQPQPASAPISAQPAQQMTAQPAAQPATASPAQQPANRPASQSETRPTSPESAPQRPDTTFQSAPREQPASTTPDTETRDAPETEPRQRETRRAPEPEPTQTRSPSPSQRGNSAPRNAPDQEHTARTEAPPRPKISAPQESRPAPQSVPFTGGNPKLRQQPGFHPNAAVQQAGPLSPTNHVGKFSAENRYRLAPRYHLPPSARHPVAGLEIRPSGFYDRLTLSAFPKTVVLTGKDKPFKSEPHAAPASGKNQKLRYLPQWVRHPVAGLEIRPSGFYDRLTVSAFPTALALAHTDKIFKSAPPPPQPLAKKITPPQPKARAAFKLEVPSPFPNSFMSLLKGKK